MISKETTALISIAKNGIILNPKSKNKEQIQFLNRILFIYFIMSPLFKFRTFYFFYYNFCYQFYGNEYNGF